MIPGHAGWYPQRNYIPSPCKLSTPIGKLTYSHPDWVPPYRTSARIFRDLGKQSACNPPPPKSLCISMNKNSAIIISNSHHMRKENNMILNIHYHCSTLYTKCALCATEAKHLKFSKSQTESDGTVIPVICNLLSFVCMWLFSTFH